MQHVQHPEARDDAKSVEVALPPELGEFLRVAIFLTLLSVVYCVVQWFVLHRSYPYDWPFFLPAARFSDFTIYQHKFGYFHTARFFAPPDFPFTYPAPMALLYEMFFKFTKPHCLAAFLGFIALSFSVPAILFGRALARRGLSRAAATTVATSALLLSWPAWILLDRANVEVFVWVAIALGVWAYCRKREGTASALFGVAASLKLFPIVYLALFLTRRGLPKLLIGMLTFAAVTLMSLWIVGPTFSAAFHVIYGGLEFFRSNYAAVYLPNETGLDHSLLGLAKTVIVLVRGEHAYHSLRTAVALYLPTTAMLGLLLYWFRIRRLPVTNQILALCIVSILFTPFSGDGTLIHLYCPFALCCFSAINTWRVRQVVPGLRSLFLCFAFLLSAESFFIVKGLRYEGQVKCVALVALLYLALRYPQPWPLIWESKMEGR
jgi:hypothetical protein